MKLAAIPHLLLFALVALLALIVVTVPLDLQSQWMFAGVTIVGAIVLGRMRSRRATLVLALLSLIASTRYLFWRTTTTLSFDDPIGAVLGIGLYLAELYAWVILAIGIAQTAWPMERQAVELQGAPDEWPTVDVYVPTYNEGLDIVRNTVLAAMDMDYPRDRFRVYLLDDGRRAEFRAFARSVGCGYITRSDNNHAKAGNLNAAMSRTDGSLIAIFDCDHVPTRAFLQMTVGWFQREAKLALVQTPHHFYSPDPVQRNLGSVKNLPGEGDLFYGAVQRGNDLWNAAFFCGSCAIIRRAALADTGGFAFETVTEDAHTALKLQRKGWSTAYLGLRLSAGLATERLVLHIGQRIRWARGMTQILRIDNPLFGPGLSVAQRLCYLNAMLHFQFPLPRIAFLTSPLAYLILGENIIHASASMIFAYAAAHLYCSQVSGARLQGGDRRPLWGEVYETILAFHLAKPTVWTMFKPRGGKFNVTDKGSLLDRTHFDTATVRPHLICIGLVLFGIAFGVVKWWFFPHLFNIQGDTLLLNTVWAVFSLVILLAAVSVARETRQVREHIRIPVELPGTLYFADGHVVEAQTIDLSMGGIAIAAPEGVALREREVTHVALPMGDEMLTLPVRLQRIGGQVANLQFQGLDMLQQRQLVRAVMGRSDAWAEAAPRAPVSTLQSLGDIVKVDLLTLKRLLGFNRAERRRERTRLATSAKAAAIAALLALGATIATPRAAIAQTVETTEAQPGVRGVRQERLTFRDLRVRSAIRLAGTRGEIAIPFGLRANEVVTGANLTLTFAWSPALLADLSQLVVILNGEVVRTFRLSPDGAGGQQVTIPVNPALFLPGDNQLNLRMLGHYARDCEDPFHSSLWANVSNTRSAFDLTIQTLPLAPDLARLPAPFFDRADNLPLSLPFVFAGQPTDGELEAAASMASWFGRLASYRGFTFKPSFGSVPRGNAIVFMRPGMRIGGFVPTIAGPSAIVIRNPYDPFGELLLVMGRDARELKQAAAALAVGRGTIGGATARFDGVRIPTWERYGAPRWLRSDRPVKLGELVDPRTLQGVGLPPGPLTAGFRAAPDLFFWPRSGARLDLNYRYPSASWLDRRGSRLDVSINNQYLRTLPLGGAGWWQRLLGQGDGATSNVTRAQVDLPSYNLFGQNELIFDYNLILANKKRCEGTLPDNVRVAIDPDSAIDLTHAYHAARMPSLATFANAGYPFTVSPDLAETTVLLPANVDAATVEAYLVLMGRFGDATGAATTAVSVARAGSADTLAGRDVLVVGTPGNNLSDLFAGAPVGLQNGRIRVTERNLVERIFGLISPYGDADVDATNAYLTTADRFTGFVSFRSPYDAGRTVVAMLATDPTDLPGLVQGLADQRVNAQVQGDLSIATGDTMRSFAVGQSYWSGSLPAWMRVAWWFSERPLLMGLSGLLVAILLAGPLYLLLKRQQAKRLGEDKA
ncbi:UDP-forming cellulose synthase catalytic subunit [Sphingomonas sp. Leaf4]|uniref:UDP-forming cellulose synthase catalytic subunit n=1 Tax=Sphingomonas sp. Leaf4 TaxID=2876553 RepID=UPI001E2E8289|nr:UDP-forming cellulose synthase catalytic subunit [Sphingomonas sp. Leaf4]